MEYILNKETKKIELHSTREEYQALSEDQKREIKSSFLFSRSVGGWVSRAKYPNTAWAIKAAENAGAENGGIIGERLSFSEQMEAKAERAEARAERMEMHAENAKNRGEALQKPINDMHSDIAFFTQPNISTSAGRAFTNRRNRMFSAYEKGWEEFKKSEYFSERAETARKTAETAKMPSIDFCQRRIEDAQKDIRALNRSIAEYSNYLSAIENGETPRKYGWEVQVSKEKCNAHIERLEELKEEAIEKEIYYREIQERQGGVKFSKENIKPGYIVKLRAHWKGIAEVVSTGPKNFKYKESGYPIHLSASYSEIEKIIEEREPTKIDHPFKEGMEFTVSAWESEYNADGSYKTGNYVDHIMRIVRCSEKSATLLDTKSNKKLVRKIMTKNHWSGKTISSIYPGDDYRGSIDLIVPTA